MEWYETESRRQITETAERFARKELVEKLQEARETKKPEIPREAIVSAGRTGLLTGPLPEELGGIGLDGLSEVVLWDRVATGMAGMATLMALHTAGLHVLSGLQAEVPAVRAWLENELFQDASDSPCLLGLAIPETVVDHQRPAVASLTVEGETESCCLQGDLLCLPAPSLAKRILLLLPTEDSREGVILWVDAEEAAGRLGASYPGSGMEELEFGRLSLEAEAPMRGEVLCRGGLAGVLIRKAHVRLRLAMAAIQTGNAEAAFLEARAYARDRFQTGRAIIHHQEVQRMLCNMETQVQAARSFVYRAAAQTGEDTDMAQVEALTGQAHRFCDGVAETVCLDAIQVLGGYGYMKDYGVEKRLRDAKSLQALLGSYCEDRLGPV